MKVVCHGDGLMRGSGVLSGPIPPSSLHYLPLSLASAMASWGDGDAQICHSELTFDSFSLWIPLRAFKALP